MIPIKKSPSSSSAGLFSEIKKKFVDVVDGGASSKPSAVKTENSDSKDNTADNIFDQVDRKPLLADVRATRAKAPGKLHYRQQLVKQLNLGFSYVKLISTYILQLF